MTPRFAIFDMDGTLVDSMPYWSRLTDEYLEHLHLSEAEILDLRHQAAGMSLNESAELFQRELELDKSPREIALEMGDLMDHHYQNDIQLRPGTRAFLEFLRRRGTVMCVATLTPSPLAKLCLDRLGIGEFFSFVLSSDDVGTGKDKPEFFLQAAWELGVYPPDTVVFDDALYAARAAREAGCFVVGVYEPTHDSQWPQMEQICNQTLRDWETALEQFSRSDREEDDWDDPTEFYDPEELEELEALRALYDEDDD